MTKAPKGRDEVAALAHHHRTARPVAQPSPTPEHYWLYAPDQFELATAARLLRESRAALTHVDYVDNGGRVAPVAWFRLKLGGTATTIDVVASGVAVASLDGVAVALPVETSASSRELLIRVDGMPAALGVTDPSGWLASTDGDSWRAAGVRPGGDVAPHTHGEPIRLLELAAIDNHYELDVPALGRIVIEADSRPSLSTGETIAESLADAADAESRHDLDERSPGVWVSRHELGLRYARVGGSDIHRVSIEARVRSVDEVGAFITSDETLNDIWAVAAATLHTCMQSLVVDGIKRDRLPWQGDQIPATIANAYSFADAQIVRDTIVALGRPREGYVNGIADYSLWWLVNLRNYGLYFGIDDFVRDEAQAVVAIVTDLARSTDERGLLRPTPGSPVFAGAGPDGVFLDWGAPHLGASATAFQLLWLWALRCAAEVLRSVDHPTAVNVSSRANRLEGVLTAAAWSTKQGRWMSRLDCAPDTDLDTASSLANIMAVLAGVRVEHAASPTAGAILNGATGTPFMRASALTALRRLGETDAALADLTRAYGAQLHEGAATYAEEFSATTAMYGRPFGKSQCHAWSSSPAFLLPQLILGLESIADGWAEFTVNERLGGLAWAAATVSTPHGPITVIAERQLLRVWIPAGTVLVLEGRRIAGPAAFEHLRWPTNPTFSASVLAKESS